MRSRGFEVARGFEDMGVKIPVRKTKCSAAYDIEAIEDIVLPPFKLGDKPILIKTGLKSYMMEDEVLILAPRSSGPKKQGIMFPHSIGVIDSDYYENPDNDGHIMVQVINIKDEEVLIKKGDAVCQAFFTKYLVTDTDVSEGVRVGGFGSTDKED